MRTTPILFGALTAASLLFGSSIAQATPTPTETVEVIVGTVMDILNDPMYQQPRMSDARRAALETVIRDSVNYHEMARRSLGITWMALSQPEQEHFSDLFVQILRDGIACRMNTYSDTQVIYLGERREGDFSGEFHGVPVLVDNVSAEYLKGAVVDNSDALTGGGFKISNPRAKSSCGCGKSFEA